MLYVEWIWCTYKRSRIQVSCAPVSFIYASIPKVFGFIWRLCWRCRCCYGTFDVSTLCIGHPNRDIDNRSIWYILLWTVFKSWVRPHTRKSSYTSHSWFHTPFISDINVWIPIEYNRNCRCRMNSTTEHNTILNRNQISHSEIWLTLFSVCISNGEEKEYTHIKITRSTILIIELFGRVSNMNVYCAWFSTPNLFDEKTAEKNWRKIFTCRVKYKGQIAPRIHEYSNVFSIESMSFLIDWISCCTLEMKMTIRINAFFIFLQSSSGIAIIIGATIFNNMSIEFLYDLAVWWK